MVELVGEGGEIVSKKRVFRREGEMFTGEGEVRVGGRWVAVGRLSKGGITRRTRREEAPPPPLTLNPCVCLACYFCLGSQ